MNLNSHIKSNILKNVATMLHRKTTLPEWLELLHDQLAGSTEVNSHTFVNKAAEVRSYDKLKSAYFVYLMQENKKIVQGLYGKYDDKVNKQVEDVLDLAIETHTNGGDLKKLNSAANSAANSAYSAANSAAYSAAYSAANSAYSAANSAANSANSAYSAANSAAYSAAYSAANSAANSAYSAANSANSAYSAAYSASYSAAYKKHAEKLMGLLDKC